MKLVLESRWRRRRIKVDKVTRKARESSGQTSGAELEKSIRTVGFIQLPVFLLLGLVVIKLTHSSPWILFGESAASIAANRAMEVRKSYQKTERRSTHCKDAKFVNSSRFFQEFCKDSEEEVGMACKNRLIDLEYDDRQAKVLLRVQNLNLSAYRSELGFRINSGPPPAAAVCTLCTSHIAAYASLIPYPHAGVWTDISQGCQRSCSGFYHHCDASCQKYLFRVGTKNFGTPSLPHTSFALELSIVPSQDFSLSGSRIRKGASSQMGAHLKGSPTGGSWSHLDRAPLPHAGTVAQSTSPGRSDDQEVRKPERAWVCHGNEKNLSAAFKQLSKWRATDTSRNELPKCTASKHQEIPEAILCTERGMAVQNSGGKKGIERQTKSRRFSGKEPQDIAEDQDSNSCNRQAQS
ncbi:hypothetical protein GALMADRAFT_282567 [Galerina marginata CBS 339.88]|uniref:Uncharacterized protein n=1 Tax=Galerina marginata (strain CBS 339.88) TaxID=685588 RepID=A0A067SHS7_GALM3|nr:hypothetical protein GALMADRAFT_282567 [Galerina marginata CBS 339.88]